MIIHEFDLFRDIPNEVVEELITVMEDASYNSGEVVFSEGDLANNLYVLQSGALNLFMAGTRQTTCVAIKAGEAVGWSSLVGRKTYSATVKCAETSRLYKINKDKLDRILRQHPGTGLRFYKKLAGLVGERVIKCYQEIAKIREES
jgi:CRP-like cAMP-binding protein